MKIILGARGSKLSLIMADEIKKKIPYDVEIRAIKTSADKFLKPLDCFEEKGIFVKEIEDELLNKNIDIAIHSMKDVPTDKREGLEISAITKRLSPYDCLVSKDKIRLLDLPKSAKVGTGSIRRRLAIKNLRKDLEVIDIRGNVTTRIEMVKNGGLDAIVVAEAGLIRLSLSHFISEVLGEDIILPAPGQGSIGIQIRKGDNRMAELVRSFNDKDEEICIKAERSFLSFFEGGCRSGIGALARIKNNKIILKGSIFSNNKKILEQEEGPIDAAIEIGENLAEKIRWKI